MTTPEGTLHGLVSSAVWEPDWSDVLIRAGERPAKQSRPGRRHLVLAIALLVAIVVPLTALSAANDWWFFSVRGAPAPSSSPMIVKTGIWDGHPWSLVAYPSNSAGLCFGITPSSVPTSSEGAGLACGSFVGASAASGRNDPAMSITYLSGSASTRLPAYIAGPVIDTATTVEVRFTDGRTARTTTFAAPAPLARIRFYAMPLPPEEGASSLTWVAGLDAHGTIVACLAPATAKNGISARSDCA